MKLQTRNRDVGTALANRTRKSHPQSEAVELSPDQVEKAIRTILSRNAPHEDAKDLLPIAARAFPGTFIYAMVQAWRSQDPQTRSIRKLRERLDRDAPRELSHPAALEQKLKGRRKVYREESVALLTELLASWHVEVAGETRTEVPFRFPRASSGEAVRPGEAAKRISDVIYGPVYGLSSEEIRIRPFQGYNTADFLAMHKNKKAIIFPVRDQPMYGADPVSMLAGTRRSLQACLEDDSSVRLIWLLKSASVHDTLDYVRYLFERSFLSTLFQLLKISAERKWSGLRQADSLMTRLCVCVYGAATDTDGRNTSGEAQDLKPEEFIPSKEPERWRQGSDQFSFSNYGFVVVADIDVDNELRLAYWKHTKPQKSLPAAFTRIESESEKAMITAHRAVVQAAEAACTHDRRPEANGLITYMKKRGWSVMPADEFLNGADLFIGRPKRSE